MENGKKDYPLTDEQKTEMSVLANILNEKKLKLAEVQFQLEFMATQMNAKSQEKAPILNEIAKAKSMIESRAFDIAKAHGIDIDELQRGLWKIDSAKMAVVRVEPSPEAQQPLAPPRN